MGHRAIEQGPLTDCTRDALRRYFDEGVVPWAHTVCHTPCNPWTGCPTSANTARMSVDDLEVPEDPFVRDWRFLLSA